MGCPQSNKASSVGHSFGARRFCGQITSKKSRETNKGFCERSIGEKSAERVVLHCAAAKANHQLRFVRPSATEKFARIHDESVWQCLATIFGTDLGQCAKAVRELATLLLHLGGMGSGDRRIGAVRLSVCPWSHAQHPEVASSPTVELAKSHILSEGS